MCDSIYESQDKNLLKQVCNAIERVDASAEVILYGSRARGDADPESDYDLLILTDGKATLVREDNFRRELFPIELETGAVITVILINKKDWQSALYSAMPFYQNIKRDGVRL
ncbi:MAG: nucleotidyltransferase domain-containing protein [Desulfobacterales bacterium]|jgi:predicted nucleotidyltransferase